MNFEEDILIEKFLKGELSEKEKAKVVARIKSDFEFREAVRLEQQMQDVYDTDAWSCVESKNAPIVNDYERMFQGEEAKDMQRAILEAKTIFLRKSRTNKNLLLTVISTAAIVLLALLLWPSTTTDSLYYEYLSKTEFPSLTTRDNSDSELKKIAQLYAAHDYKAVLSVVQSEDENASILLYKAIAEMELENLDAAKKTLNSLLQGDFIDAEKGYWFKALLCLKQEDFVQAKIILDTIVTNNYYNSELAKAVLKDLE